MAYVKHTAIHTTPKAHLKYILNPDKNEKMKYVTGICCGDDLETAYDNFKEIFEKYNDENFDNCETYQKSGKRNIRIHSYTQSFNSSVSPEEAHRIGVEWAKKVFGKNRPIIVSTHSNTEHCHNHIAVCPYDLDGIRWHSNRKSLDFVRKRSDEICLEHDLDIIKNPKRNSTISYKEWDSRKKKCSWKVRMADTIDKLIHSDDVTDIYSLIKKMKKCGYTFTNESRLIAKPKDVKYGCCIAKLGFGYSYQMLMERISHKQNEFVGRKISAFVGFQVELAVSIREKQLDIYRTPMIHYPTYAEVKKSFEILNFIHSNHIHSLEDMAKVTATANRKEDIALHRYCKCAEKKEQLKTLNYLGDEYACLLKVENRDEAQQRRLEKIHWQLMISGGIGGWNTHMDNWLPKLKDKLRNDLKQLDSLAAEMGRASKERSKAEMSLAYLENFLKSDYDRIREQEQLRIQIENYHNGLEPQEDGTYKAEPELTAERNAEFEYMDMREEQRRIAEEQRWRDERQREMRNRSRSGYCR
ncbi:relaxase/mobilization nuclease domain-containing protein [Pseudoruminococcus massiliensis]|uniref:relaxase/mobilization nuclease domain-containing protein n=1 Tax=Pseudoruminococcus massiliensis TaxID=2086583 RepID=UPI00307B732B